MFKYENMVLLKTTKLLMAFTLSIITAGAQSPCQMNSYR